MLFVLYYIKGTGGATQGHKGKCKRHRLWVRFPLEKLKYLIFLYPCVEFCHSTWNASKIRKVIYPFPCA